MLYAGPTPDQPGNAFWRLVDLARSDPAAADAAVAAMDRDALIEFYWAYDDAAALLRDAEFENEQELPGEDGVEDATAWAVAQGEAFYRRVLAGQQKLPNDLGRFKHLPGEVVMRYEKKFHEALPYPAGRAP